MLANISMNSVYKTVRDIMFAGPSYQRSSIYLNK